MRRQEGQSTFEFLMSIVFSVGILYLFIFMGFNYTRGYLAHYATFLASRVYLTVDNHIQSDSTATSLAINKSKEVFDRFKLPQWGADGTFQINALEDGNKIQYVGATYEYSFRLSPLAMIGGDRLVNYVSESFLGKEPTVGMCARYTCEALESIASGVCGMATQGEKSYFATVYDNGC